MTQLSQRSKLSKLDGVLDNLLDTYLKASECVKEQSKGLQVNDYDLVTLFRSLKDLSTATGNLIDQAPFLAFRDDFEAIDRCKEWVLTSSEWIGDKRQIVLDFLTVYQQELIIKTGKTSETQQYQLL